MAATAASTLDIRACRTFDSMRRKQRIMKLFYVHLKNGKEVPVNAEGYVHDNGQYTFQTADGKEVQFFKEDSVDGIREHQGGATVATPGKRRFLP